MAGLGLSVYQELNHDSGSTCYSELLCYYHLEETATEGKPLVGTELQMLRQDHR